jgi:hypothetical protein
LGVLVSGTLGLLAGCRQASSRAAPAPSAGAAGPDPLVPDLADEQRLLNVYDGALHDHPELAGRLRPLRSNHAAHVAALQQAMGLPAAPENPAAAASLPAASPAATLAALRSLEHAAVLARTASAIRASGGRAALLASLAACSASHEEMLV